MRRPGSDTWTPFVTKRESVFDAYQVADNGGTWVFERPDGWAMKVATCFVSGRQPKQKAKRGLASKGRGSSRRRNMRALRGRGF